MADHEERQIKRFKASETPLSLSQQKFFDQRIKEEYDKRRIDLLNYQEMVLRARKQRKEAIENAIAQHEGNIL